MYVIFKSGVNYGETKFQSFHILKVGRISRYYELRDKNITRHFVLYLKRMVRKLHISE